MKISVVFLLLLVSVFPPIARGQNAASATASSDEEYRIGPNDVVQVEVLKLPEISREYHVAADGSIEMSYLGNVKVQQKTGRELAALIASGLKGGYLVDPQVSVIVKQTSRKFFIQGAVRSPGAYPIEGKPSLLQLIAAAGGLNSTYGGTAFIFRRIRSDETRITDASQNTEQPDYELKKANLNALMHGNLAENSSIEPGDIIQIPPGDVFFVAGDVKSPGPFPLTEGTTLRQAISLAQGTLRTASPERSLIFREDSSGQKREIAVDVDAVMHGKKDDVHILPNDIIVAPNSKAKSTFLPLINALEWAQLTVRLELFHESRRRTVSR